MLANLVMMLWATFNGFLYFRVIRPLDGKFTADFVKFYKEDNITSIEYSVTTVVSLFIIQSQITFYSDKADQGFVVSLFNNSNLQRSWESLTNNIVYILTELLQGRQTLHSADDPGFYLHKGPRIDTGMVPHCFQEFNALRDAWSSVYYSCIVYVVASIAQLYIAATEVLFKRIDDFADERDRRLSPEQMRARITIGLEGVAALQRVCFFSKLVLVM
uniref:Anoctamin n=1 Tax=Macrostomum lignano TaxID=282301 RepID=A0A1I8HZJ9_9PLAT